MNMALRLVALALLTVASSHTIAQSQKNLDALSIDEVTKAVSDKESAQKASQVALAPIRSEADLADYLRSHRNSPFDAFSKPAREKFLGSLVFTDLGLGSYRTTEVESELTPRQAYALLSLFGVHDSIAQLDFANGSEAEREAAKNIGPIIYEDHKEYRCQIPATCIYNTGMICIGQNCGGGVP